MFGRKNKEIKYNAQEYKDLFYKYIEDKNNYKYYKDLYNEIRKTYENKIANNEIDISIERVRLQAHTGKYNAFVKSFNGNIIILGISTLINSIIVACSVSDYSAVSKFLIIFGCGLAFYSVLLFIIYKIAKDDDGFVKDLCLQVLDDIERESNIAKNSSKLANKEVAVTIEDNQEKEQKKYCSNSNNGNWSVNISSTSFVDMVEGTYKAIKFISRLVKKKKKSS